MEITPTVPRYQTRNSRWHPKFNSYNCNMFFAKIQLIQSLTRPTTHAAFSTFSTFSFLTIFSTRVLQHQKQTKYSMLQIKTFFVVLLKRSFLIHLCCLKKYSVREINNFPKRYTLYHGCQLYLLIHTYIHTYIHTHTHTYIYIVTGLWFFS